jgi:transposase-like protein
MIRLVSENQKNKGILLVFAKAVINKSSWFHSQNHMKVQDLFKKFLSILLSLFYEMSDFVYKYLLSKIGEEETFSY